MKNTIRILIAVFLFGTSEKCSAQNNQFFAGYPNTWNRVQPINTGYILISFGNDTLKWAKTDITGTVTKAKAFSRVFCSDAKFMPDNSLLSVGKVSGDSIVIMKIDSSGNLVWSKGYAILLGAPASIGMVNISPSNYHGNFWVTGSGGSFNHYKGFILKADSTGNIILKKEIDSIPTAYYVGAGPMIEGDNNSCYFTADVVYDKTSGYPDNTILFKTDSMVNLKWATGLGYGIPGTLIYDSNNIILGWSTAGLFTTDLTVFPTINLTKIDTTGLTTSTLFFKENYFGSGNSLQSTHNKGILYSGNIAIGIGILRPFAFKIDSSFNLQWAKVYGMFNSSNNESSNDVKTTKDNGFIMAGDYLIKTDSSGVSGCHDSVFTIGTILAGGISPTTVTENSLTVTTFTVGPSSKIISEPVTYQCYTITGIEQPKASSENIHFFPNPNGGRFIVEEKNGDPGTKDFIEIYNVLGEKIFTAILNTTSTPIDISDNASGIYLYRVLTNKGDLISKGKFIIRH